MEYYVSGEMTDCSVPMSHRGLAKSKYLWKKKQAEAQRNSKMREGAVHEPFGGSFPYGDLCRLAGEISPFPARCGSVEFFVYSSRVNISLNHIRSVLSFAQPQRTQPPEYKRAAVLIALFLKHEELHVLLTRRTESVEHHKGQISFPGGAVDDDDADAVAAALREAEEEIGLPRNAVEVLGVLDHYRTPSRYSITPVVGFLRSLPSFAPSAHEVAEIFDIPLAFFADKKNERIIPVKREGRWREVYFYNYGDYEIWGVTAAIIRSFLHTVCGARAESA